MAPFGQKATWMSPGKHPSRIGAESRSREGISRELFGAGQGTSDYAIGTPDGVEADRAIKLGLEKSAWNVGFLLRVKGLLWDGKRAGPTVCILLPSVQTPPGLPSPTSPTVAEVAGGVNGPRRAYIRKDVEVMKYGRTSGCSGCQAIETGGRAVSHSQECRARGEQMMRDAADGAERLELARQDTLTSAESEASEQALGNQDAHIGVAVEPPAPQGASSSSSGGAPQPRGNAVYC